MANENAIAGVQIPRMRDLLRRELDPSETVYWSAQKGEPARGPGTWLVYFWAVAFGAIGTGTLYGAVTILINGRHDRWPVAGLIILPTLVAAVGLTLLWGAWGMLRRPQELTGRAHTAAYAMTGRRLLTIQSSGRGDLLIASVAWPDVVRLKRREQLDGRGDLVFELTQQGMETVRNIPDVREVERIARERLVDRA